MDRTRTFVRSRHSVFDAEPRYYSNPLKAVQQFCKNIKYAYQRVKYGYCDKDVWNIDDWFLSIVPNMLEDLRTTSHWDPETQLEPDAGEISSKESPQKWNDILSEMEYLLRESSEVTCSKKNQYEPRVAIVRDEFSKKYGDFGEKLRTSKEIKQDEEKKVFTMHFPDELPENKELWALYLEEERKLQEYRQQCRQKGLSLFQKWFDYLGD